MRFSSLFRWGILRRFRGQRLVGATEADSLQAAHELDKKIALQQTRTRRLPSAVQLKYLPRLLSTRELLIIRVTALIVIASAALVGFRFLGRHVVAEPAVGGEYVEALVGSPNRVNPLYAVANDVDQDLAALVYSGLFKKSAADGIIPDLAESYALSEDGKVYTIRLRSNAVWHDGDPVTIDDVLFTFESIQNSEYASPLSISFRGVTLERVDDQTLKFTLSEPFAPFLGTLTFGILPAHIWGDVPPLNVGLVEYNLKPIGSGPYRFERLTRDRLGNLKNYDLVRNESYYNRPAYIKKISFRFYPDFTSAIEAVKNKKVQGISYIPEESKADLDDVHGLSVQRLNLPQFTAIFFNVKRSGLLKDRAVREALARATNAPSIITEALGGDGVAVSGPILRGMLGFNPDSKTYPFDPDQARQLLDNAGWKLPENGTIRTKDDQELTITVTTSRRPAYEKTLEILTRDWAAVGVKLESNLVDASRIQADVIKSRKYDALLYGEVVGFDPDPYPFWHSSQQKDPGLSLSIFYRKEIDKALERARQTANLDERVDKYREFQNLLAEEIPAVFLYQPTYAYGLANKVKGFGTTIIEAAYDRFANVTSWYIATKQAWK